MTHPLSIESAILDLQRDGVAVIRGLFAEQVETIRAGTERNLRDPGPCAAENLKPGNTGRFFDDFGNCRHMPEFVEVARHSPTAAVAVDLMRSDRVQMVHDHVLINEPGNSKPTPRHQDGPNNIVEGRRTFSCCSPVDPVTDATLRHVAGSHRRPNPVLPMRQPAETGLYPEAETTMPVPEADAKAMDIRERALAPGNAVVCKSPTRHGARGNTAPDSRRAFSRRRVGADARHVEGPGRPSPPCPGHDRPPGQRRRDDGFPVLRQR